MRDPSVLVELCYVPALQPCIVQVQKLEREIQAGILQFP